MPANANGLGPDTSYLPVLKRNSKFTTAQTSVPFLLVEDVDFKNSLNQVIVSDVDTQTGNPLYYAVKTYGQVISGDIATTTIEVGDFTPYKKFELNVPNL